MTTKDKILKVAQDLFNKNGIGKVTVRNICETLHISLGNFTYHFPNKQNIVLELYYKMIAELEQASGHVSDSKESILYFLEFHKLLFTIQNRYRFFYLNNFELLNQFEEIRQAYLQHKERERKMMRALFLDYLDRGLLKSSMGQEVIERLISIGQMVNSFWLVDAEINFKGSEKKKLVHYMELCCSLIENYLTPKALQAYQDFFQNLRK